MTDKRTSINKKVYLKVALVFFASWLFLAYIIYSNIQELGGLSGLTNEIINGAYSDVILLAFSIFCLAKFFQNLFIYLSLKDDAC